MIVNPNSFEIIRESRLENFLIKTEKEIDKKIPKPNQNINNPVIFKDGKLEEWKFNETNFAEKKHIHDEYVVKIKGKSKNILLLNDSGSIEDSGVGLDELVNKQLLNEKTKININGKNNTVVVVENGKIKSSDINIESFSKTNHSHEEFLNTNIIDNKNSPLYINEKGYLSIKENIFADKIHSHDNYIKIPTNNIDKNKIIVISGNEIKDSGLNVEDIPSKKDLINKLDNIYGEDDYILILKKIMVFLIFAKFF